MLAQNCRIKRFKTIGSKVPPVKSDVIWLSNENFYRQTFLPTKIITGKVFTDKVRGVSHIDFVTLSVVSTLGSRGGW